MARQPARNSDLARTLLLAAIGFAAVAGPIVVHLVNAWPSRAQSQADAPRPIFEVASIKPGDPNDRRVAIEINPGGRFQTKNMNLKMLIAFAYDVRDFQISDGPEWLGSEKYNIEARPEASVQPRTEGDDQVRLMLQELFADRFFLRLHRETKELPVYELVVAKSGPKLHESNGDERGPSCNVSPRGRLTCQRLPMTLLAADLSRQLGRKVADRTGIPGSYDVTLEWAPGPGEDETPLDPNDPSIFTALQEQLGLRLESAKGPVEILVIDHVERPSEN